MRHNFWLNMRHNCQICTSLNSSQSKHIAPPSFTSPCHRFSALSALVFCLFVSCARELPRAAVRGAHCAQCTAAVPSARARANAAPLTPLPPRQIRPGDPGREGLPMFFSRGTRHTAHWSLVDTGTGTATTVHCTQYASTQYHQTADSRQ
jgi:hypothetical protein